MALISWDFLSSGYRPVNAVRRRDDPAFVYQRATAGDFLVKVLALNDGHLPGNFTEFGIFTADYLRIANMWLAAVCFRRVVEEEDEEMRKLVLRQ